LKQLITSRTYKIVCYVLIVALLGTIGPLPLATPASAQLLPQYSVGVVDFINESGVQGELLARLATDAVVVEMGKTNRYDVSFTRTQIKEAMEQLDLRPPLTKLGLVRLGELLAADAMLEGSIKSVQLTGSGPTRRASVTLAVQMVDQASGEIINGAVQTGTSSARVGYAADDDSLITEAINNAAFLCVKTMVDYIIPEATIMMNIKSDRVMLNKGVRDGLKPGMRMIVLRRKEIIGYIEVQSVSPSDSMAKVIKSMRGIQPEDKARAIFDMPTVTSPLKSEPLPSGAPKSSGGKNGAFSTIAKALVGAGIIFGLISLFKSGRGSEDAPNIGVASNSATVITWDPTKYGHGKNVLEYQILRDEFGDSARPVMVIRDPGQIDYGKADVYPLYGPGQGTAVSYYRLDSNPSTSAPTETTWTVPAEPYGVTHTYQVRVLYRLSRSTSTGTDGGTSTASTYYYTPVSNRITATAIEPVKNVDVVSPAYNPSASAPEILISDLLQKNINFEWNRKDGADLYYMKVEPVQPGTGPTWQSQPFYETGPIVSLPDGERIQLANALSNSRYAGVTMKWRVYCRHSGDTSPAWREGQENRFIIGATPPSFP